MKIKSFILLLACLDAYAAGPTGSEDPLNPPNPTADPPKKIKPIKHRLHQKAVIFNSTDLAHVKEKAAGCAYITLFLPRRASGEFLQKLLNCLPQKIISLCLRVEGRRPPSFFQGLKRFPLLRHLTLPDCIYTEEDAKALSRRCNLKSLTMATQRNTSLTPLSLRLEHLTLEERSTRPPARNAEEAEKLKEAEKAEAKELKKAVSRLRNLKTFTYETPDHWAKKTLNKEDASKILLSLPRKIESVSLNLKEIDFKVFKKLYEKGGLPSRLSLRIDSPDPKKASMIDEAEDTLKAEALFILLRNLNSLSLTDYSGLARLFRGAATLEKPAVQHLTFNDTKEAPAPSEEDKALFDAFEMNNLKTLTLKSTVYSSSKEHPTLLSQILTEKNVKTLKNVEKFYFHTLNIDTSLRYYNYGKGNDVKNQDNALKDFLEIVFAKTELETFSFTAYAEDKKKNLGQDPWVCKTLLQRYKEKEKPMAFETLHTLKFGGSCERESLKNLFQVKEGILGNSKLKKLAFEDIWFCMEENGKGKQIVPKSLIHLLSCFVTKEAKSKADLFLEEKLNELSRRFPPKAPASQNPLTASFPMMLAGGPPLTNIGFPMIDPYDALAQLPIARPEAEKDALLLEKEVYTLFRADLGIPEGLEISLKAAQPNV